MDWKEEEQYLLENWASGLKEDILKRLNRKWGSIIFRAGKLGVKRRGIYSTGNLSKLLEETPIAYYYIGLLMADGHFSKNNCIDISLHEEDKNYLQKYANYVEYRKEMPCRVGHGNTGNQYRVGISDQKIVPEIIKKFNLSSRKTYAPPKLTDIKNNNADLYFCLFIGFIDGDGNIRYKKNRKKELRKTCDIRITCHGTWLENFIEYEEFLYKYFSLEKNSKKKIPDLNGRKEAYFYISDMDLIKKIKSKIVELGIYNNVMHRKWDKIDLNYENPQFKEAEEKINKLKIFAQEGKNAIEISKELGCTPEHIYGLIRKYNLYGIGENISKKKRPFWTEEEINILKEKYPIIKGQDICNYFPNRSYDTIVAKANNLNIRKEI